MSSVSEPLAPTSTSVDSTVADSITSAAEAAGEASADASQATDSTLTDSSTTDNPTDPALVTAGVTTVTPDEPPAPQRPKKKRRWLRAVGWVTGAAVVVTMTGATGYVSDHHHVHIGVYPTPASSYTSPVVLKSSPPPKSHAGNLARFLMPMPSGGKQYFKPRATHGIMSLKQVASYFDDAKSAASDLKAAGFVTAATENWHDPADNYVEIRIFRFASDTQAYTWYGRETGGSWDQPDMKGATGTTNHLVPENHAMTFTNGKKDRDHQQLTEAIAVHGDVVIVMWVYQDAPQSEYYVDLLTLQQWSRL